MFVTWFADTRPSWRVEVRHDGRPRPLCDPRALERALRDSGVARSPRVRVDHGQVVVSLHVKADDEQGAAQAAAVLVETTARSVDPAPKPPAA
jgi:hypothetical protein